MPSWSWHISCGKWTIFLNLCQLTSQLGHTRASWLFLRLVIILGPVLQPSEIQNASHISFSSRPSLFFPQAPQFVALRPPCNNVGKARSCSAPLRVEALWSFGSILCLVVFFHRQPVDCAIASSPDDTACKQIEASQPSNIPDRSGWPEEDPTRLAHIGAGLYCSDFELIHKCRLLQDRGMNLLLFRSPWLVSILCEESNKVINTNTQS